MDILTLNAGSSSEKLALYRADAFLLVEPISPIWSDELETTPNASLKERSKFLYEKLSLLCSGKDALLKAPSEISVVGHRVVHGGIDFQRSAIVDASVKEAIKRNAVFAPLQNPFNLLGIEAIESILPGVKQVAVFDTAFHSALPAVARLYPVPTSWHEKHGVQRFGFHGTSHFYVSRQAAKVLGRPVEQIRLVTCHLGNGCSLAAVSCGKSIDTTMGLSTLDGLMMGTRSGAIDPGIVPFLLQNTDMKIADITDALYHQSGLLAVSGLTNDMREIEKAMAGNEKAKLAFDCFIHSLTKNIAAMVASMGGVDGIVFTGGIGENSAEVRKACGERLSFLSLSIDSKANSAKAADRIISDEKSAVKVLTIKTREDWVIAHDCWTLLAGN